jgi:hypothetical protein
VLLLGTAACSDEAPEAVSQEQYDELAQRLCDQHADTIARAFSETIPDSDSEEANYYTGELIPIAKAMIQRLVDLGFPPDRDADYRAGLVEANDALNTLAADPYRYIDQRHEGIDPDTDLLRRVERGFHEADIPC